MSSRQPSLTIPSVPTTESSADAWRRKAELSLHPLEQVDRDCVKRGSNCQQLREKFDAWKLHGPATTRDSVINLHSTPEHLECFRRLIEKIFYCNVNVSYLYAMVRVSLEAAQDHAAIFARQAEMVAGMGQTLRAIADLGVRDPSAQQIRVTSMYTASLNFLASTIGCFRSGPIEHVSGPRWLAIEEQYKNFEQNTSQLQKSYRNLEKLPDVTGRAFQSLASSRQNSSLGNHFTAEPTMASHCVMLPAKNPRFFGRDAILRQIDKTLAAPDAGGLDSLMLHGLGGIGKTEIAREYAYRAEPDLNAVLWIRSKTPLALAESFSSAAMRLDPIQADPREDTRNKALVLNWLSQPCQKWLLIFDNAEDRDTLEDYWPSVGNGRIIVTTRTPELFRDMTKHDITVMLFSKQEGADCILKLAGGTRSVPKDLDAALELSNSLDGLPLGVSQIAGFTVQNRLSLEAAAELYQRRKREIQQDPRYTAYKPNISTVWEMQFQSLKKGSPARTILGVLVYLLPDAIPDSLFRVQSTSIAADIWDRLRFCNDIMDFLSAQETLLNMSLVQKTRQTSDVSLHRLVQEAFGYSMGHDERQVAFETAAVLLRESFPKQINGRKMHDLWEPCKALAQHVLSLNRHYMTRERDVDPLKPTKEFCHLLSNCAWYLYEVANYRDLADIIRSGLDACGRMPDQDDVQVLYAHLCNTKAVSFKARGHFTKAIDQYTECLQIREKFEASNYEEISGVLSNLSLAYESMGNFDECLKFRDRSLEVLSRTPPSQHRARWIAMRKFTLARVLMRTGDMTAAEQSLRDLLKFFEGERNHWYLCALVHFSYGNLHLARSQYEHSRICFSTARTIIPSDGQSGTHPVAIACTYKLGRVALEQQEEEVAVPCFLTGKSNPADDLHSTYFREALSILNQKPMTESHKARVLFMLSKVLSRQHSNEVQVEAADYRREAQKIFVEMRPGIDITQGLDESMFNSLIAGQYQ